MNGDVQQAARLIANAIEEKGHFQGQDDQLDSACIVRNSGYWGFDRSVQRALDAAILRAAGIEEASVDSDDLNLAYEHPRRTAIIAWNDSVETDEVLDVLRGIEVG